MSPAEFRVHLNALDMAEGERDGYTQGWYDAAAHVLNHCEDGGISETYMAGLQYALDKMKGHYGG